MSYKFDVEKTANSCIEWISEWLKKNAKPETKVVIGISGGKDSTVTAALLCQAIGKERVIGVMMPNGTQADIKDSVEICEFLGIKKFTINIATCYKGLTDEISQQISEKDINPIYKTNTPARIRMTTLFAVASLFDNAMVVNTCNLSEDVMGYSTFYGDSAGCFAPISKLTTEEVVAIGSYLSLPSHLINKAPSDGMCGKTDEDNLGWTYHEVNELIRKNIKGEHYEQIVQRYKKNAYKIDIIRLPCFESGLPFYL